MVPKRITANLTVVMSQAKNIKQEELKKRICGHFNHILFFSLPAASHGSRRSSYHVSKPNCWNKCGRQTRDVLRRNISCRKCFRILFSQLRTFNISFRSTTVFKKTSTLRILKVSYLTSFEQECVALC